MEKKREEIQSESQTQEINELTANGWSVVSFDRCEARHLTYEQAEAQIKELTARKVSGLCIITDEAAERIKS